MYPEAKKNNMYIQSGRTKHIYIYIYITTTKNIHDIVWPFKTKTIKKYYLVGGFNPFEKY